MLVGSTNIDYRTLKSFAGKPEELVTYVENMVPVWARHIKCLSHNQRFYVAIHLRSVLTLPYKTRMELVDKFNKNDTNCFLITLKSGGTGLNLTSADVVIHLDIWWNPQVENQATDRAHRIGQKNKVTVIKMVTKGTIEERIIELQNKKKILSDNLIEGKDNSEVLSSLSEKDIKNLLASGEDD